MKVHRPESEGGRNYDMMHGLSIENLQSVADVDPLFACHERLMLVR